MIMSRKHEKNTNMDFIIQGESKKSVISGVWCKVVPFFCLTLLYGGLKYFWKFFYFFFGTLMNQKKREPFFSQNPKFRKANMCIYIISIKLKNFINIESQKTRKIVIEIRNFQFWSILEETLFFNGSSGFD